MDGGNENEWRVAIKFCFKAGLYVTNTSIGAKDLGE